MDCQEVELIFISDTEEDDQNEYIFLSDTDDENDTYTVLSDTGEEKKLTIYSYKSNYTFFEYFVGYEIATLLEYKDTNQAIRNNVSECNKIIFKNYRGIKIPKHEPKTILISKDGVLELINKSRKYITNDIHDLLKKYGIYNKVVDKVNKVVGEVNKVEDKVVNKVVNKVENKVDDDEEENRELTTYSYINGGYFFDYFVGYEIATLLGYANTSKVIKNNVTKSNQLIFKDYPGVKTPELDPRTILITRDGAIELLIKTRKRISNDVLHLFKTFGIDTTNRKCLTKEQQTLSHIANVFKTENFQDQFKVGKYYLDMYFADYKIVIECDENGHSDRKPGDERDRMDFVNFELNMDDTYWIRYNPDEYEFDIMKVIGAIYRKIDEIKAKNSKSSIIHDKSLILYKKCTVCFKNKTLNNFKYDEDKVICNKCIDNKTTTKEKVVFQYDMDGNYIAKYSSIKEASSITGLYTCQIGSVCNGKTHMIKGMVFRFATDEGIEEGENIEPVKYYSHKKIVAQYDINGKYMKTYEYASEAGRQIGASKESIIAACKKSFLSHGFLWRYLDDRNSTEDIKGYVYVPNRKYMRHVEVYKDDVLFKTFPSITEAAKQMDRNVSMCRKFLNDNKKDNRGFEWKFKEIK